MRFEEFTLETAKNGRSIRRKTMSLNNKLMFLLSMLLSVAVLVATIPSAHADEASGKLFAAKCAMCHGPDGAGSAMGKKLGVRNLSSTEVQSQSDAELIEIITKGKNKMPAYDGKLKAEEIKALVGYIRTLVTK
jgi:cytochrome c6